MKNVIIIFACVFYSFTANSQSIGLRASTIFSEIKDMNYALGPGVYINLENSTNKFGMLLFGDFIVKTSSFDDCADCLEPSINSTCQNGSFGLSPTWNIDIYQKINFKTGPLFNYNFTESTRTGQVSNWIESIRSEYIGTGILLNLQIQKIFKLPLNFDVFITPSYFFNVNTKVDPTGLESDYSKNQPVMNLQMGLAYVIK